MHVMLFCWELTTYPWDQQYEKSWWGEGVGSRIASPQVAVEIRPAYFPDAVAAAAGVACSGPRADKRLVDTVPLYWFLLRCRGPCQVPFVENGGCWVAGRFPVSGDVPIIDGIYPFSVTTK